MAKPTTAMHVDRIVSRRINSAGETREYISYLVRRTYREHGKVRHETLANISRLPHPAIEAVRRALSGRPLDNGPGELEITRCVSHGHVAAALLQARLIGLPEILGPAGRRRTIALGLIVSHLLRGIVDEATPRWWSRTSLGADLGLDEVGVDEMLLAAEWLLDRRGMIEATLAARHLADGAGVMLRLGPPPEDITAPARMTERDHLGAPGAAPLAASGRARPGRVGGHDRRGGPPRRTAAVGILAASDGRPIAARTLPSTAAEPAGFAALVAAVHQDFRLLRTVLVGDHRTLTAAHTAALMPSAAWWIVAERASLATVAGSASPAARDRFPAEPGRRGEPLDLIHPDHPAERLIVAGLAPDRSGPAAGDVSVLRTSIPRERLDASGVLETYRRLTGPAGTLLAAQFLVPAAALNARLHPGGYSWPAARLLIANLASYLRWHLQETMSPLISTENIFSTIGRPSSDEPARESGLIDRSSPTHLPADAPPSLYDSLSALLDHLATLARSDIRLGSRRCQVLTTPTEVQRTVFGYLGGAIPLTLM